MSVPKRVLPEAVVPELPTLVVTSRDIRSPDRLAAVMDIGNAGVNQLAAATGLGKTVFLPQYMVRSAIVDSVVVLEPEETIARSAYNFVRAKYTAEVSLYVGGKLSGSSSKLRYTTYRDFLNLYVAGHKYVKGVSLIYVDEAHVSTAECYVLRALCLTVFVDKRCYFVSANFLQTQNPLDRIHSVDTVEIEYVPVSKWKEVFANQEKRVFAPSKITSRVLIFAASEKEVDTIKTCYMSYMTDVYSLDRRNFHELPRVTNIFYQRGNRPCVCVVDSHFGYGMTIPADIAIDTSLTYVTHVDVEKSEITSSCVAITPEESIQHAGRVGRVAPGRYYRMNVPFSESRELQESEMYKAYAWLVLLGIRPSIKFDNVESDFGVFTVRHAKVVLASELHPLIVKSYLDDDGRVFTQFLDGLTKYVDDPKVLEISEETFDWSVNWFLIPGSDTNPLYAPYSLRSDSREAMIDIAKKAVNWEEHVLESSYDYGSYQEPEVALAKQFDLNRFGKFRSEGQDNSSRRDLNFGVGSQPEGHVTQSTYSSSLGPSRSVHKRSPSKHSNSTGGSRNSSGGSVVTSSFAYSSNSSGSGSGAPVMDIIARSATPRPVSIPVDVNDLRWRLEGLLDGSIKFQTIESSYREPLHKLLIQHWNHIILDLQQVDNAIGIVKLKIAKTQKKTFRIKLITYSSRLRALEKEYDSLTISKARVVNLQKLFAYYGFSMDFKEVLSGLLVSPLTDVFSYTVRVGKTLGGQPVGQTTVYRGLLFTAGHTVPKTTRSMRISGCLVHEIAVFNVYDDVDLAVALRPPFDQMQSPFEIRPPLEDEKVLVLTHIDKGNWSSNLYVKYASSCKQVSEFKWSHGAILCRGTSGCPVVSLDCKYLLGIHYSILEPGGGGYFVPLYKFVNFHS